LSRGRMRPATALLVTVVVSAGFGCGSHPEPVTLDVPTATTTKPVPGDGNTPASTSMPVTTAVVTTVVPSTSRPAPVPTTTSVVPGAPLPEVPPGFCAELAVHSGDLMSGVEKILPDGDPLDGPTLRALLIASRDLLIWTAARVPVSLASEVGALVGVYHNIGAELERLDPGTVTEARIRGVLFTSVFGSSSTDGIDLEVAAIRLAAFVNQSCGPGYPLLTSLGDIFAIARPDDEPGAVLDGTGASEPTTGDGQVG